MLARPETVSQITPRRLAGCGPRPLLCSSSEYVEYPSSSRLASGVPRSAEARSGFMKQALVFPVVMRASFRQSRHVNAAQKQRSSVASGLISVKQPSPAGGPSISNSLVEHH